MILVSAKHKVAAFIVLGITAALIGCSDYQNEDKSSTPNKTIILNSVTIDNQELVKIREDLINSMLSYMDNADVKYTRSDICEADKILNNHYKNLRNIKTKEEADLVVKNTVIDLNHLNYKTDHQLIETDQRELICKFIIKSGASYNFNKIDEDVIYRWREW